MDQNLKAEIQAVVDRALAVRQEKLSTTHKSPDYAYLAGYYDSCIIRIEQLLNSK